MHVVKKEFMYVLKPFGGEGGGGLQRTQYVFLKKVLSAHYVPTMCARTMPAHRLCIVCTNAPRALHGGLLLGASKHG